MHCVTWGKNLQQLSDCLTIQRTKRFSCRMQQSRFLLRLHAEKNPWRSKCSTKCNLHPSHSLTAHPRQIKIQANPGFWGSNGLLVLSCKSLLLEKRNGSHLEMHPFLVRCAWRMAQPWCSAASWGVHSTTQVLGSLLVFSYFWCKMTCCSDVRLPERGTRDTNALWFLANFNTEQPEDGPPSYMSALAPLGIFWDSCTQMLAEWWPISHWAGDSREGLSF